MLHPWDYLDSKLVLWSLKCLSLASSLLSLFGREVVKLLCTVAWPFISYYKLGQEIAQRVGAVLQVASDSSKGVAGGSLLTHRAYKDAPRPVRQYLQYALREGQPQLKCVCIKQSGYFRFLPTAGTGDSPKAWKKLHGETYVSLARPGMLWSATIHLSPFTWVRGFASYLRGRGSTQWKLCSLFCVDDIVEGERSLDTVALLRFLAEAPCYPTALLPSAYLRWEAIDHTSARAIITDAGLCASAVFRFNALGQIVGMRTTDSARSVSGGTLSRDPYCCYYRHYRAMHGLNIPTEVEAAWELGSGEYSYAQLEVEDLVCWDSMEMLHRD